MMKKIILAVLVVACSMLFISSYSFSAEEEEDLYTPFYFPYTAESENWFQSFYHPFAPGEKDMFKPFFGIREEFDDNIYLSRTDEESDWITNLQAGFVLQPNIGKHKFLLDYLADFNFFADHDEENNDNHTVTAGAQFKFKKMQFDFINMFHDFSDRSGLEDLGRIDRTQNYFWPSLTLNFNKLDILLGYNYRLEKYHSEAAIGDFQNQTLNYKDLDRHEEEWSIETDLKLWTKTSLLLAFDYGFLDHDTGKKSDSDYYDILVGLRGQPTAKSTAEARIGFREQDYDNYDDDFASLVFDGSWIEKFNDKNSLRLDFKRTTNDTIFQDNAYYESTYIASDFRHDFSEKLSGNVGVSYQLNYYPTESTIDGLTDHREDDFWSAGAGLGYKLAKELILDLKYQYRQRESNFSRYDYDNNRISLGLKGSF